jgi:GH15 family glucan-1,4-alpha-glucosidase
LTRGWNSERQAFTQHYDTRALDASNLHIPLVGFLPASDKRVISTIERTVAELNWNGLLRRYRTEETDDGLGGPEGAFLACSFWLVRNLLRQDKMDEAISLYEKLLGYGNHLGLFSEMADPDSGEALGNFPQAFTHLAIITTGLELMHLLHTREGNKPALILPTIDKETAGR